MAGVPPAGIFMNADRTAILPDKLYLLGDAVYTGTGGSLRLLAYRHEVMSGGSLRGAAGQGCEYAVSDL